jgi:succinate-semialdehyde dehydrogenase/glutarate-semialdehyde dehydrogenase
MVSTRIAARRAKLLIGGRWVGLATGVFTRDINRAMTASRRFHVGVVHINEASASRVDMMPFAGVKGSGLGREGPKYAMQEMTEERLVTISLSEKE